MCMVEFWHRLGLYLGGLRKYWKPLLIGTLPTALTLLIGGIGLLVSWPADIAAARPIVLHWWVSVIFGLCFLAYAQGRMWDDENKAHLKDSKDAKDYRDVAEREIKRLEIERDEAIDKLKAEREKRRTPLLSLRIADGVPVLKNHCESDVFEISIVRVPYDSIVLQWNYHQWLGAGAEVELGISFCKKDGSLPGYQTARLATVVKEWSLLTSNGGEIPVMTNFENEGKKWLAYFAILAREDGDLFAVDRGIRPAPPPITLSQLPTNRYP